MADETVALCRVDDIAEGRSRGFSVEHEGGVRELFVVRRGGQFFAYRNSCPHTGSPLDWVPDQFLNLEGDLIQCATHDALFRIDDGLCVRGPCAGQSLDALTLEIEADRVRLVIGRSGGQ